MKKILVISSMLALITGMFICRGQIIAAGERSANTFTKISPTPTQTQTSFPEYDLTISQWAAPNPVAQGDLLIYSLTVVNSPAALGGVACPNVRFGFPTGSPGVSTNFYNASGTNGYTAVADPDGVSFSGGCVSSQGGVTGIATLYVRIFAYVKGASKGTLTSMGSNVIVDPENNWPENDETNNTAQTIQTTVIWKVSGGGLVQGTVTYGNAAIPPRFVSNALVWGTGQPPVQAITGPIGQDAGQYNLTGFNSGNYTISVSKGTGVGANGISSNDAARIAQHVAGVAPLTTNIQKVTADTSNNGTLSSNDAALLARYVAGVGPPVGTTGTWRFFVPPGPTFPIGTSQTSYTLFGIYAISGLDFVAVLGGEVTGNWTPTNARPTNGQESGTTVTLPSLIIPSDREVLIPVSIQGAVHNGIISYQFDLRYDPGVIQPGLDVADVPGTASRGLTAVVNSQEPGLLRVVLYGAMPVDDNGVLLNLRFHAVGASGSVSQLIWERFMFNEGDPQAITTDGQIEIR